MDGWMDDLTTSLEI